MNSMFKRITASFIGAAMTVSVFTACDGVKKSGVEANLLDAFDAGRKQIVELFDNAKNGNSKSEYGQKSEFTLTPEKSITSALGFDAKSISLSTQYNMNGTLSEESLKLNYGDKTLASANVIEDLSNGDSYIKIDDLTDKYLKLEASDIYTADNYFESLMPGGSLTDGLINRTTAIDDDTMVDSDDDDQAFDPESVGEIIKNLDIKGVVTDIKGVINEAAKSLPKAYSESSRTIWANDISAKFDVKRIKVSGDDIKKALDSAKQAMDKAGCIKKAVSCFADYDEFVNNIFDSFSSDYYDDLKDEKIALYYYGDELVGYEFDQDCYLVCSDTTDGFMFAFNDKTIYVKINLTAVPDGDDVDVEFTVDYPNQSIISYPEMCQASIFTPKNHISLKLEGINLDVNDNSFDSELKLTVPVSLGSDNLFGGNAVFGIDVDIEGDEDKFELTGDVSVSGDGFNQKFLNFSLVSESTEASAVKLPEDSECIPASEAETVFSQENIDAWLDGIKEALGSDFVTMIKGLISDSDGYGYDYSDDPVYDLSENYGVDYYDYYNDAMTEFDMDKFLADAEKAGYPDMEALKAAIEEQYEWGITGTPNLATLESDYDIDYYDYYNDAMTEFDMDKFLADAEKAGYPDMEALKKEIEEEYQYNITVTPNLSSLYYDYDIDYTDYYDEHYTEFDMEKFLADAKKAGYPDLDALKKEAEEDNEYMISQTPNIDALSYDYNINIYDYFDYGTNEIDTDKYLKAAKKAGYPDMDALEKELKEYCESDFPIAYNLEY